MPKTRWNPSDGAQCWGIQTPERRCWSKNSKPQAFNLTQPMLLMQAKKYKLTCSSNTLFLPIYGRMSTWCLWSHTTMSAFLYGIWLCLLGTFLNPKLKPFSLTKYFEKFDCYWLGELQSLWLCNLNLHKIFIHSSINNFSKSILQNKLLNSSMGFG